MKLSALALAQAIANPQHVAADPHQPKKRSKGEKARMRKERRTK